MPTYDYTCELCGHTVEAFQKMSDGRLVKCPECGKDGLIRSVGGKSASFRFKGTGFYITDYKKESSGECGSGQCGNCS